MCNEIEVGHAMLIGAGLITWIFITAKIALFLEERFSLDMWSFLAIAMLVMGVIPLIITGLILIT